MKDFLSKEENERIKEGVRELIREHRARANNANLFQNPAETCPFVLEFNGPDSMRDCPYCVELFPAMIDFLDERSIRPFRNNQLFGCSCNVLGKEVAVKLVSMYMGEWK